MGLNSMGAEVTGVDIFPQKNYPFKFIQADAVEFDIGREFDFIWASPPCQAYTRAQKIRGREHVDLIDVIRQKLLRTGRPFCIENVEGAPLLEPTMLCGGMFYGLKTYRHRLFEAHGFKIRQPEHERHTTKITKMGRSPKRGEFMHVVGNFSGIGAAKKAMGIDWMVRDELREAIPPAYSEYVMKEFLYGGLE